MSQSSNPRLPAFFPLIRTGCEDASSAFFQCLVDNSEPQGDETTALNGLKACEPLKDVYEKCIRSSLEAKEAIQPFVLTEWESE